MVLLFSHWVTLRRGLAFIRYDQDCDRPQLLVERQDGMLRFCLFGKKGCSFCLEAGICFEVGSQWECGNFGKVVSSDLFCKDTGSGGGWRRIFTVARIFRLIQVIFAE